MNFKIVIIFCILLFCAVPFQNKAAIITTARGFSAVDVDKKITQPLENILSDIEEIKNIYSESSNEKSFITVQLRRFCDKNAVYNKIRTIINNSVLEDDYFEKYDILIGIKMENESYEEFYDRVKILHDKLLKSYGVRKAKIFGAQKEALYLTFDNSLFVNLKLTPEKIQNNLMLMENALYSIKTKNGSGILTSENFDPEKIENFILNIENKPIKVKNIFKVEKKTVEPKDNLIQINGKNALVIGICKKKFVPDFIILRKIKNVFVISKYRHKIILNFENNSSIENLQGKISKIEPIFQNKGYAAFYGIFPPSYSNFKRRPGRENCVTILTNLVPNKNFKKHIEKILPNVTFSENQGGLIPSIKIHYLQNEGIMAGIEQKSAFDYINVLTNGKILTHYYRSDIKIPIILKGETEDFKNSSIYSAKLDKIIPLRQIINFETKFEPALIKRKFKKGGNFPW